MAGALQVAKKSQSQAAPQAAAGTRRGGRYPRAARYRQIADVLARHGMGYLLGILGLRRFVPVQDLVARRDSGTRSSAQTPPQHVRMALEELGTTFIKLGQILSTRPDLLPPEYLAELSKLQDAAPQVPWDAIRELVVSELGKPLDELFASFDPQPLAAASIGQAHAATLRNGTEVVVKVRRPGVVEQVECDLAIIEDLAATAAKRWPLANQYDLPGLAQEFAGTLRAELDYVREGHNAERFAFNCARERSVHIPRIFWETTTQRVLTLERIRGIKISDGDALDRAGIDRRALAVRAAKIVLKMIFEDGYFHADPHPGNFFVEPNGRIGLIDFGMVGALDEGTQEQLAEIILSVTNRDVDGLVDTFLRMGIARAGTNRNSLRRDLEIMIARYYGLQLGEVKVGQVANEALEIVRHHHLQLPANLALLVKTLAMHEGLGAQLDPGFEMASLLAPYARWLAVQYYSPFALARRMGQAGLETARLAAELPRQVRNIMGEVERGGLEVGMRPEGFEPVVRRFERLANRIVLGIIVAALINGLAILLSVYRLPGWEQWVSLLFAVGFVAAIGLAAYLAWSILRSG